MLLGNKKLIEEDQDKNWCVVLGALENEIDRKRVAQRISEIFSISIEEAGDLVRSTPIILLDQLSRIIANKLKDYFASFGAPLILSKDVLFKRKCYRTVWPQNPSLSFLHDWQSEESRQESRVDSGHHEALNPDQALDEIRAMMSERITKKQMTGLPSKLEIPISDSKSFEDLKKVEPEVSKMESPRTVDFPRIDTPETSPKPLFEALTPSAAGESSEIKALRESLRELKNRYDQLNDQYDRSRQSFETQIISQRESNETLLKKLEETSLQHAKTQEETQKLTQESQAKEKLFHQLSAEQQGLLQKFQSDQAAWVQESGWMREKIERLEAQLAEFHSLKAALDSHKEAVSEKVQSLDQKWTGLEARGTHYVTQEDLEQRFEKMTHEFSAIVREEIQKTVRILPESLPVPAESESFKVLDQKFSQLCVGLEKQCELTEKVLKMVALREMPSVVPATESPAESKTPKMDAAMPQWNRVEHEKQLAARLTDKEALLKRLVGDQERIEKEIHDREDQMRRILTEQEKVEKEIMEVRQAQRQFLLFDKTR